MRRSGHAAKTGARRAHLSSSKHNVCVQDVCVFDSESVFGRVLTLDGVIQVTEKDEFSYQEMICHLPLCGMTRAPEKVLIIGGGDGGVAREIAKHACVKHIDMAEIDKMVPEVSKRFFPHLAKGFQDARLNVHIGDGVKFLEGCPEATYDAIVVDSSDPVGPAEALFQAPFFKLMHRALKPGGVLSTQAESLWLHMDIIESVAKMCKEIFVDGAVNYAYTTIPTYPSGQIGFMICQKGENGSATGAVKPQRKLPPGECQYYHPQLHSAAFILPAFAYSRLQGHLTMQTSS
jgi:spermidine synthase